MHKTKVVAEAQHHFFVMLLSGNENTTGCQAGLLTQQELA